MIQASRKPSRSARGEHIPDFRREVMLSDGLLKQLDARVETTAVRNEVSRVAGHEYDLELRLEPQQFLAENAPVSSSSTCFWCLKKAETASSALDASSTR